MNEQDPLATSAREARHKFYQEFAINAQMTRDIHRAMMGDGYGNKGFSERLSDLEKDHADVKKEVANHGRLVWLFTLIGGFVGTIVMTFKNEIKAIFAR